ncbi:acetolactate synthase I/II/III large subunit [Rubrobacter xylanophilus]|uniref:Acetolactate synthase I/II/III large subunit n=1 Tax=Rubrobacter xylanophilus TaxID=49319 RepID=A0A510HIM3_9ACTN|nr:thiamine pyrophosphate-dependent enzyme [Rubrobacter xylanophilus]BBL79846.1 acetolactate synthase I/II/III large subunit [Rubrobacter xylanophilus]
MIGAGEAVVRVLAGAGVRRAYTVPGESFLEVLDAAERHPQITLVSTRHESGAAFMAEAEAKLTGVPAVAMATRGVGASNLAIGVHTARQDSTPMVVLLGQVETSFAGREAFQEVDLPGFYRHITKWSATVYRADLLAGFVERALRTATSGRPGPVMLALPADVLGERVAPPETRAPLSPPRPAPSRSEARRAAGLLGAACRPVIVAGELSGGARGELVGVAERYGAGVYTAFRRQDRFPNGHPNYLGHLGLGTPPSVLRALEEADVVLVVGCRLDEATTQGYALPRREQAVVSIHPDPETAQLFPAEVAMAADVREALALLLELAPEEPPRRDWSGARTAYLRARRVPPSRAGSGVDPARAVAALRAAVPGDAVVANDAGNFSLFLHRHWSYDHPRTQLAPANGAMGYGVPAAVAAKLADPGRCVVAVCGDGGFLMSGQELETAVRYGLPVLVVVLRNGLHGTIAMHQLRSLGRTAGVEIEGVDLAAYAHSLGARGYTVGEEGELEPVLREALASGEAALVDVMTDPEIITPESRLQDLRRA